MGMGMGGAITAVAATTTVGTAAITMVGTAATTTAGGIIVVGDEQTKKREEHLFGSLWEHRSPRLAQIALWMVAGGCPKRGEL